ncbi:hypothetical protein WT81_32425 [Burkholderia stagnalis]|nr:hypothetical protein WT80_23885 [Burkholderia stagnalis]KWK48190.1 hypothetical protein WT81_32425 [Burkholderia stagnalis]
MEEAADASVFYSTEREGSRAVQALFIEQPDPARAVAECHVALAEEFYLYRVTVRSRELVA